MYPYRSVKVFMSLKTVRYESEEELPRDLLLAG